MMWTFVCLVLAPAALLAAVPPDEWEKQHQTVYTKLHQGCFRDKAESRDLPYLVRSSDTENSVTSCIRQCREQGFRFAGLQNGDDCYCGNNVIRRYDEALDCNKKCPGNGQFTCGGASSNDVYHVSTDEKYMGCYNDSKVQRDLPFFQWDKSSGKVATDCIHTCSVKGYRYAGVQDGGTCYCGNEYGRHGPADEEVCGLRCAAWANQNCGGAVANAIYKTETVGELSDLKADKLSTRLWDRSGQITGIPTTLFTFYPALQTVLTKRLIIHTNTPVQAPVEDSACANNCYKTCGDIHQEDDLSNTGSDVTLRFFYIKLSEISKYVGKNAQRVYVYAQTILIDESVDYSFALLLRTKQLFIDRSKAININVKSNAKAFDLNLEGERFYDVEPNLLQQKMAMTCARIMYDTQEETERNLAFTILRDIANTRSRKREAQAFAGTIRGYLGEVTGVTRAGVHFVPFYTKERLSDVLKTYFTEINIYRKNYDKIRKEVDNTKAFLEYAETMSKTYTDTDITESKLAYDAALTAVIRSNETYHRFRFYYNESRDLLDELKKDFEKGLKEKEAWDIARAVVKFITGIGSIVVGAISFDKDEMADSVSPIIDDVTGLFDTAYNLANTVRQIDELSKIADRIIKDLEEVSASNDYLRNLDDVEQTVQLNVNIIKWKNLKNYGTSVLGNPEILRVRGAATYHRQLLDLCNWGEALTKAMVERAELLRGAINSRTILDAKIEQQRRLLAHIEDTRNGIVSSKELVLAGITEQSYDVRMDLNKALIVFCQAYFYENMYECKQSYKPSFGGSLTELLVKINAASLDNLLTGSAPSTVQRELVIRDDVKNATCNDNLKCPISYLKQNRMLFFELPTSHPGLIDLDAYKVAEIRLNFTGVKTKNVKNPWLKVRIESSGEFKGRAGGESFNFLTKSTSATFEYNIITNHISVSANIDIAFRNIVQRITPFTTWVMRISPTRSADIDFSDVTSVSMRFFGSAVDNETWLKMFREAHPELIGPEIYG